MKKRWLLLSLTVVALVLGIGGGVALAQGADPDNGSSLKSFVSRVASILGVDEQQAQDAFDQAAKEMRDEAMQNKLDAIVESGKITREEADEYEQWYQSRPESISPGFRHKGFGGPRLSRGGRWRGHGMCDKGSKTDAAPSTESTTGTAL